MTTPNSRQRQAFEAFKKAWEEYPSQDNEGYVPDRGGFKCGWFAALQWADSTPWPQGGDDSDQVNKFLIWILDHSEIHCSASRNEIINRLYELIAHARRAQNAEIEQFRDDNFYLKKKCASLGQDISELRALLEKFDAFTEHCLNREDFAPGGSQEGWAKQLRSDYDRMKERG